MQPSSEPVFISYRRDDAAGHAGRLEEALEKNLGRGSVFRDLLDIAPGDDFAEAIRSRLAGARAVLVLIGPHWAGGGPHGQRRIDQPDDFVRMEVALALETGARVIPVLLPGAEMPGEASLPDTLKPLARRQAVSLGDAHWDADVARLLAALGWQPHVDSGRRLLPAWAAAAVVSALAAGAAAVFWWPLRAGSPAEAQQAWAGRWQADVTYGWGDRYTENFELQRHAGQWVGTASFLGHPREMEALEVQGAHLSFVTHTRESVGQETREVTHHYSVELSGQPPSQRLQVRMHTRGSFDSGPPLQFEARRAPG